MGGLTFSAIAAAGLTVFCGSAIADSAKGDPTYIGDRSTNPEQETFGYRKPPESPYLLAFIGPARYVGRVTGDEEKDTFGYKPVLGSQPQGVWLFRFEDE